MENNESQDRYGENRKNSGSKNERVAVVGAVRSPFVKSFGVFENETALSLSLRVATELIARTGVQASDIDECIWGVVIPQTKNANLAREIVLFSGLPTTIAGFTLNKACNSSLQTAEIAADRIRLGKNQLVLAGGVEVLSDVPIPFSDEARRFLTKMSRAKSFKERLSLIGSVNPKWFLPKPPALAEPFTGLTMGDHAEIMCVKNNISRARQDELAYKSHNNAAKATEAGHLKDEVIPIWCGKDKTIFVDKDNMIRSESTVDALSKLKPVFDRKNGTITAGNASPLTDGASGLLLASESYVKDKKLPVLGYLVDFITVGVDPNDQLLIGPAYAIPKLLKKNNLSKDDIDVYEIHEAFAGQVLSCLDAMKNEKFCKEKLNMPPFGEIPAEKINIQGGAIAIGHPFGATGARLIGNALRIANRKNGKYAVVAVCAAGGMGMAVLLETK
ncbi:thiolase family protein [Fluviispira multicolorata]|uniref:acetyl-CoA C-acyltransferase n=1 Tax=Fluviispira multicolorata TaxID=2654512 RepID=A0A833JD88_9BACT|nr:thiolase family protein [Fluviispira multicolorata]KAB8031740.1 acetyl-CoA C-acyltransferase [Fluviispira multicolorata]